MEKGWFSRFFDAVMEEFRVTLMPLVEEDQEAIGKNLWSHIFDLDERQKIEREFDSLQTFMSKIFYGLAEVVKSREALFDLEFYVNRFPFSGTRISREQYLQFHVEVYFSELYILRERLKSFVSILERQYKRDPRLPGAAKQFELTKALITKTLNGVIEVRSGHVHETRFVDDGIERLSTLGMLARAEDPGLAELMSKQYLIEHRKVKKLWHNRIVANNKEIARLLEVVFEALFPIVFDADGKLRVPHGIRTK